MDVGVKISESNITPNVSEIYTLKVLLENLHHVFHKTAVHL